jgi:hypothetical protein
VVGKVNGGAGSIVGAGFGGLPRRFFPLELPEFVDSSCEGACGVLAICEEGPAVSVEGPATGGAGGG